MTRVVVNGTCASFNETSFNEAFNVVYCEKDTPIYATELTTNDSLGSLWGFSDTDIPKAWAMSPGKSIVIAVIDTGVDVNHPSLKDNLWVNDGEIPGNGIDDDGNGYVDDVHGWDFVNNRGIQSDGINYDDTGHGTHVSGTIAGRIGVNSNAKIMVLKFMSNNQGSISDAVSALEYAISNGAKLSNHSYGTTGYSQALKNAISAANDATHLLIAAAGNTGSNIDQLPLYPASFDFDNIISVAASMPYHQLAYFSNYGNGDVDIVAPGTDIYSTIPGGGYGTKSGTSMAAPLVTGIVSLGLSLSSTLPISQLKKILMETVTVYPAFDGKVNSKGIVNAQSFLSDVYSEIQGNLVCRIFN